MHHGLKDDRVSVADSENLKKELEQLNKKVELITYENGDHNLSQDLEEAMKKTIKFYKNYR